MKLVMSFWSKPWLENLKAGRTEWEYPSLMLQSVALSLGMAKSFFPKTELITDSYGERLFCKKMGLKFDNVINAMDDYQHFTPSIWAASKIVSHSLQREPYLHIDNDVFFSKKMPEKKMSKDLIVQSREFLIDKGENGPVESNVLRYSLNSLPNLPKELKNEALKFKTQNSLNCGVVGGHNVDFMNYYSNYVLDILSDEKNRDAFDNAKMDPNAKHWVLNVFVEQYILAVLAKQNNIKYTPLIKRYSDGKKIGYSHFLWKSKISHGYRISTACATRHPDKYIKSLHSEPISIGVEKQKNPKRPLRVGILSHSLNAGGIGTWIDLLLRNCPKEKIEFKGIFVVPSPLGPLPAVSKQATVDRLIKNCKVVSSKTRDGKQSDGVETSEIIKDSFEDCDVLIGWGLIDFDYLARDFKGLKIYVAHLTAAFSAGQHSILQSFSRSATKWAGVSINCIPVFNYEDQKEVVIIPNAVDKIKCLSKNGRIETRKELGYKNEDKVLGYVGRISEEKEIFKMLGVMDSLDPSFKLLIVGEGNQKKKLLEEIDGNERIKVIDPTYDLGDIYRSMDCFILLSPEETCSFVLLEAISCGLPFVAVSNGLTCNLEYFYNVRLDENLITKNTNPEEISEKIEKIVLNRNEDKIRDLKKLVDKEFDESLFGQRWADFIVKSYAEGQNDE